MIKFSGIIGIFVFIGIAYLLSVNKPKIHYRTVIFGIIIQFAIAVFMLKTVFGMIIFRWVNTLFVKVLSYTNHGTKLLFGKLVESKEIGATLAFQALPVIIFISALMAILVYFRIIEFTIKLLARVFYKLLYITGVEAFTSSLLIFMGIEAITGVKEYIKGMNESRLFTIMVTFMATISGSVMAAYVNFGAEAGHLLTASIMSAPAAIVIAKIMIPDSDRKEKDNLDAIHIERKGKNLIESIANGTSEGLTLVLQIGAMLIAFISLIYLVNDIIGFSGHSLQQILGYLMSPFAVLIGVPFSESMEVGNLLGIKTIFTEFLSYLQLKTHILQHTLSPRTIVITTYALCGFTHFGSIAILIGGIGSLVPEQKSTVAKLAIKSLIGGFLACLMTAAIAGLLI